MVAIDVVGPKNDLRALADFTTSLSLPATSCELLSLDMNIKMDCPPVRQDPLSLWLNICRCAVALDTHEDLSQAFRKMRGFTLFTSSIAHLDLGVGDGKDLTLEALVLDIAPASGAGTLLMSKPKVRITPTELFSSTSLLLMEISACNNIWNRLYRIVEILGLKNRELYVYQRYT